MPDPRAGGEKLAGAEVMLVVTRSEPDPALYHLDRDGSRRFVLGQLTARAEDDEGHAERTVLQEGSGVAAASFDELRVRSVLTLLVDVEEEDVPGQRSL